MKAWAAQRVYKRRPIDYATKTWMRLATKYRVILANADLIWWIFKITLLQQDSPQVGCSEMLDRLRARQKDKDGMLSFTLGKMAYGPANQVDLINTGHRSHLCFVPRT